MMLMLSFPPLSSAICMSLEAMACASSTSLTRSTESWSEHTSHSPSQAMITNASPAPSASSQKCGSEITLCFMGGLRAHVTPPAPREPCSSTRLGPAGHVQRTTTMLMLSFPPLSSAIVLLPTTFASVDGVVIVIVVLLVAAAAAADDDDDENNQDNDDDDASFPALLLLFLSSLAACDDAHSPLRQENNEAHTAPPSPQRWCPFPPRNFSRQHSHWAQHEAWILHRRCDHVAHVGVLLAIPFVKAHKRCAQEQSVDAAAVAEEGQRPTDRPFSLRFPFLYGITSACASTSGGKKSS
eukprot:CAMPEP_0196758786 /NCGR_PEP_ID=MMETSP1091-20130531/104367_1 /TAXON_ID=302021 /ORGANISM="Rhodomonas sp., Strain CCMP768" /LENGTH=296 /DNA_ID=CAMNT_0042107619 /DNA_START=341 /DNA_END=1230 /DNA_ORIENTATION=+